MTTIELWILGKTGQLPVDMTRFWEHTQVPIGRNSTMEHRYEHEVLPLTEELLVTDWY